MKKRLVSVLLILIMILPSFITADEIIDKEVDNIFKRGKTVGGAVVIAHRGQIVYERYYGVSSTKTKKEIDENSYFRTASITKMISALGVLKLVDEGKIDLDEDISKYFGFEIRHTKYPNIAITLRQIMSHTAAISEGGGYSNERNKVSDMLAFEKKRRGNFQDYAPGEGYSYSNFGAGLAGSIMEAVSGQSVKSYMKENIFEPFGIAASYDANDVEIKEDLTNQYQDGKLVKAASFYLKREYEDFPSPDTHYRQTVGGVWIKARDLAKIGIALCSDGTLDGKRLLSEEIINEMRMEQSLLNKSVKAKSPYGLFLEHTDSVIKGKQFFGHQGMSNGSIVNIYFEPETEFVFVILNNGCSMKRDNRIGIMTRNMINYLYPIFTAE